MEQSALPDWGLPPSLLDVNGDNGSSIPNHPDDWEDWLRWDPTVEPLSPESSSKTSNNSPIQDLGFRGDQFPPLSADDTLAPPLIVGEDASMLDFSFDQSTYDFGGDDTKHGIPSAESNANANAMSDSTAPFTFGNEPDLQPIVEHLRNDIDATLLPQAQHENELLSPYTLPVNDGSMQANSVTGVYASSASDHRSPTSTTGPRTSTSSGSPGPEAPTRKKSGRKRKASSGDESKSGSGDSPEDGPPVKKTSHNVIEKRYRNNLNDKILELRNSVPSLRAMSKSSDGGEEDLEGLTPAHKLNKATVLAKATEYIRHLEKRNKNVVDEMSALKTRLASLEKSIARSGAVQNMQNAAGNGIFMSAMSRSRQGSVASQAVTPATQQQGRRMQPVDQQYLQQQNQPNYEPQGNGEGGAQAYPNAQGGNGIINKLMVGSMAGLMVMEGVHEQQQNNQGTSSRGLFATPTLFRRGDIFTTGSGGLSSPHTLIPLLKTLFVFGAFVYIVLPLFTSKRQPKQKTPVQLRLAAAPSLASPVEVRRKAWLTAVQSVWMPRHFLLEVVSVTIKMINLSLQRIIGSDRYAMISGKSKDDEAARIKAWDIAIDAQLAGGDAEVSYYRLLLTLMASGTLPDSPIRLMQKAVHFRVFFWELANAGYGNIFMFRDFTAKVARIYWDSARSQQHALVNGEYTEQQIIDDKIEQLPEHLAALIELGCDDVLSDEIIQRAYNLAWNRPSAENTTANQTIDSVVEDHAVHSPLDAVAAWFSNMTLDSALTLALDNVKKPSHDVHRLVELGCTVAPPASGTLTRALAVKAVLIDEDRESSIAAALDALPLEPTSTIPALSHLSSSSSVPHNMIAQTPVSRDVHMALTFAKILSLASPTSHPAARVHAASALGSVHLVPSGMTLLTAVAAYRTLSVFCADTVLFNAGKAGLDDVAGYLRLWIGTRAGKATGLSRRQKTKFVEECVSISKRVGGWKDETEERDSGYGSLEDNKA